MKRKSITKFIVCALVMGAFSIVSLLNPLARSEVVNDTNGYIFLTISQSDPAGNYSPMYWTYSSAEHMTGSTIYVYNTDEPNVPRYYPLYVVAYEGFDATGDQSYLYRGEALTTKFFGDGDSFTFLQDKVLVSKISIMFTFGFESGPLSALPEEPTFDDFALQFNGHVLDESLYTYKRYRSVLTTQTDSNTNTSFRFRNYRAVFTFNTPLEVTSTDGWDFSFSNTFSWDGYALEGYQFLTGISGMYVEYSYQDQYEAGVIGSNNTIVGGFEDKVDDLINDMHVPTVDDSTIDDIMGSIDNSSVEDVSSLVNVFDNDLLSVEMSEFLSLILIASLGIAFTGYALHGKRG